MSFGRRKCAHRLISGEDRLLASKEEFLIVLSPLYFTLEKQPDQQRPLNFPKKQDWGGLYLGMQFALTALLGLGVGVWMDHRFLPSPLGTLGGLFIGAAVGMYILARSLK